ncbi:MAG: hypothetical protein ACRC6K_01000 [Fusobacteriaceae bacterium]
MKNGKKILLIAVLLTTLMLVLAIVYIKDPRYFKPELWATRSNAKDLIESEAKKRYGKEFKVLFLGKRSSPSGSWYEGEAILKEKIGTEEAREYTFLATAEIEKGLVQEGGVAYSKKIQEEEMQEYFKGEIKKIFGDRTKISHRVGYKIYDEKDELRNYYAYPEGFKKGIEKVKSDSRNSMELVQWLCIFEEEKKLDNIEEYKEKIFKYKEYLDKEGLSELMTVMVYIINDRVLLSNYVNMFREMLRKEEERKNHQLGGGYYVVKEENKNIFLKKIKELKKLSNSKEKFENFSKMKTKNLTAKGDDILSSYNSKYFSMIKTKEPERDESERTYKKYYRIWDKKDEVELIKNKSYLELNGGN